ncbi:hypothetical protein ARMGADRAFT_29390 [Armillaria gallica]|uniref:Uncharacterized protein n=1 Tax=Armillaria gallica TaxID=47427 RepID=A0A2H3ETH3_ARMGA|nr:hypothetical protein ARMGADRAFT_29390 [Armillaria gallica]
MHGLVVAALPLFRGRRDLVPSFTRNALFSPRYSCTFWIRAMLFLPIQTLFLPHLSNAKFHDHIHLRRHVSILELAQKEMIVRVSTAFGGTHGEGVSFSKYPDYPLRRHTLAGGDDNEVEISRDYHSESDAHTTLNAFPPVANLRCPSRIVNETKSSSHSLPNLKRPRYWRACLNHGGQFTGSMYPGSAPRSATSAGSADALKGFGQSFGPQLGMMDRGI